MHRVTRGQMQAHLVNCCSRAVLYSQSDAIVVTRQAEVAITEGV